MKEMGLRIRQKRIECGMTQEELGKQLGVQRQAIHKWEKGEVKNINRDYIGKMAQIFHCRPDWLFAMDDASEVEMTYTAPGKEPVSVIVKNDPIIGPASKRAILYKLAVQVRPENLDVAIDLLNTLI